MKLALLNPYVNIGKKRLAEYMRALDNIGNAVYLDLLTQSLPNCEPIETWKLIDDPDKYKSQFDVLILPFSNMVNKYWNATSLVDTLISHKFNVLLISVGIQAENHESLSEHSISDDSLRLLQYSNSCGFNVGARGLFTSEVLSKFSISHDVIGCPTALSNISPDIVLDDPLNYDEVILALNITPTGHSRVSAKQIFNLFCNKKSIYFHQSEFRIVADIHNLRVRDIFPEFKSESVDKSKIPAHIANPKFDYKYYCPDGVDPSDLEAAFRLRSFFSQNLSDWSNALKRCDISFGGRFHGNMMALHSGVPAVFLGQDRRTSELLEYHCLPSVNEVPKDVREIFSYAKYDNFFQNLKSAQNNFEKFLSGCSISGYSFNILVC